MALRDRLRHVRHRLAHWLQLEPCQLLEVREDGVVVLVCVDCGQVLHLPARVLAKEKR